jgi:hypothetical protein
MEKCLFDVIYRTRNLVKSSQMARTSVVGVVEERVKAILQGDPAGRHRSLCRPKADTPPIIFSKSQGCNDRQLSHSPRNQFDRSLANHVLEVGMWLSGKENGRGVASEEMHWQLGENV